MKLKMITIFAIALLLAISVSAQTTEFTYQGSLKNGSAPANGNYDFEFRLYDAPSGGSQIGLLVTRTNVEVADGLFSVKLDFTGGITPPFPGGDRYLDISVQPAGGGGYTALTPRQPVTSAPYSIKSATADTATNATNATTATNATQLGGIAANQYLLTTGSGSGLTSLNASSITNGTLDNARLGVVPVANGGTGSATQNFVDLTTAQTIGGNKTFSGTVSGNVVSSTGTFNVLATPVLSIAGTNNVFVGALTGDSNTTGANNSFLGRSAGTQNNTGSFNSFYGSSAGFANTSGSQNSFYGRSAGSNNVVGNDNAFFGNLAGTSNTSSFNSFFGSKAGQSNTSGISNSFFGNTAGQSNTTGNSNSFFGQAAGLTNTTGRFNSFFGLSAGKQNMTGDYNSIFGFVAGEYNTTGTQNSFFGSGAGFNTTASWNSFFGSNAGSAITTGDGNSFFGFQAGSIPFSADNASYVTLIGAFTDAGLGVSYGTAIGAGSRASISNSIFLGREEGSDTVRVPGVLNVTGSSILNGTLAVAGNSASIFTGTVAVNTLGSAGSTSLCRNASNQISTCSSSLRYKTNINHFGYGLSLINQLKPITFDWKDGGMHDLGLGAEDVAAIEPLLVTYNDKGRVEGVKYDRIGVVLINAIKEQQSQIDAQQKRIEDQDKRLEQQAKQINGMRTILCTSQPNAAFCKEEK